MKSDFFSCSTVRFLPCAEFFVGSNLPLRGSLQNFPLAKDEIPPFTVPVMTRPQVEFCAKLLMLAIVCTFIWGLYNVLVLMGLL